MASLWAILSGPDPGCILNKSYQGKEEKKRSFEPLGKPYLLSDGCVARRQKMLMYASTLRFFTSSRLTLEQNLRVLQAASCIT
jgi:hypothetical protein